MVKGPGTLVVSLYCSCPDITATATPDFKRPGGDSRIIVIDVSTPVSAPRGGKHRLGGSALAQVHGSVGTADQVPDCEQPSLLVAAFNVIQGLLDAPSASSPATAATGGKPRRIVQALHDISDGGLITAVIEMAIAGNCGARLAIPAEHINASATASAGTGSGALALAVLFSEELGWVMEVPAADAAAVIGRFTQAGVHAYDAGCTAGGDVFTVCVGGECVLDTTATHLRGAWEETSCKLERLQCAPACADQEAATLGEGVARKAPPFALTYTPAPTPSSALSAPSHSRPSVAVLREEGSNGDRELAAAFHAAGFTVWDVTMADLLSGATSLDTLSGLRGLAFPGGFSYADTLDSGKGWAATVRFHPSLLDQFTRFYARRDTFSLGVCNGCQLMALMGWVPFGPVKNKGAAAGAGGGSTSTTDASASGSTLSTENEVDQPRFVHNASGRFESRFSTVRIGSSPSIMFKGMEGSVLGVWVAHGEGRAHFPNPDVLTACVEGGLVPLTYVDEEGADTERYPYNPNGSPRGIAGLCTPDGRHMAIMPHPERVHTTWQWPWMPAEWQEGAGALSVSPWMRMFQNAREWCEATATLAPASGASSAGAPAATVTAVTA